MARQKVKCDILSQLENSEFPLLTSSQQRFLNHANSLIQTRVIASPIQYWPEPLEENVRKIRNQIEVIEKNFGIIISCLKGGRVSKNTFKKTFPEWIKTRREVIEGLKELAKAINTDRYNCNVSKLVGYSTSLAGGLLTVTSAILIPFTLGATTPLAIAGGSMTAAGVSTAVGTSVTEFFLLKDKVEKAKELMEEDKTYFKKMEEWLTHSREIEEAINEILCLDVVSDLAKATEKIVVKAFEISNEVKRLNYIGSKIDELLRFLPDVYLHAIPTHAIGALVLILITFSLLINNRENRLVFDCASVTFRSLLGVASLLDDSMDIVRLSSLFRGGTVAAQAVTRGVVAVVGVALDIAAIALTSIDVHKGSISPEAEKIANAARDLEEEAEILVHVYDSLNS